MLLFPAFKSCNEGIIVFKSTEDSTAREIINSICGILVNSWLLAIVSCAVRIGVRSDHVGDIADTVIIEVEISKV